VDQPVHTGNPVTGHAMQLNEQKQLFHVITINLTGDREQE